MPNSQEPSPTMVDFIEAVNARLDELKISKSELARRVGTSQPMISSLLNGKGGSCAFSTADKIAEALGTTVAELLQPVAVKS